MNYSTTVPVAVLLPRLAAQRARRADARAAQLEHLQLRTETSASRRRRSQTSTPACPTSLNTLSLGGTTPITLDDPYNPRRGWNASLQEIDLARRDSDSNFNFTQTNFSTSRGSSRSLATPRSASTCVPNTLDRHHSAELAVHVLRPAGARLQPSLLCNRCVLGPDRVAPAADGRPETYGCGFRRRTQLPHLAARSRCSIRTRTASSAIPATTRWSAITAWDCASTCRSSACTRFASISQRAVHGTHTSFGIGQSL